ncbi:MAG: NRDE family protein [Desertimonas sp.]
MCLLVVLSRVVDGQPLIVAANRDERRDRPAIPMTRLDGAGSPAILGGRDEVGGGTWLATNAAGVVAGLTNRPLRDGPDAAKRSRGELPMALAGHTSAADAVDAFGATIAPEDYNPSWLLVADRSDAFFVDVTGGDRAGIERLGPGVHVLENRTIGEPSPKADRVRELVDAAVAGPRAELIGALAALLADHRVPPLSAAVEAPNPRLAARAGAICVHADEDDYGTRSSAVITADDAERAPVIRWTADAPCRASWRRADHLW